MKVITLDKNIFEKAFSLCNEQMSEPKIYEALGSGDDVEKQIALLQLSNVQSEAQAQLLVSNLTGQDGPIREAASVKIKELLLEQNNSVLNNEKFYTIYADAVCDVNPNICRCVIDFLPILSNQHLVYEVLLQKLGNVFERIDNPDKEQKNFLTVRLFNIYWCLEAIGSIVSLEEFCDKSEKLVSYLERAIDFGDYTINEKVAKIVTSFSEDTIVKNGLEKIYNAMKEYNNFYVQRYFEK